MHLVLGLVSERRGVDGDDFAVELSKHVHHLFRQLPLGRREVHNDARNVL